MGQIVGRCCGCCRCRRQSDARPIDQLDIRHHYYFKLLLVGDRNVGKSTLLQRIVADNRDQSITTSPTLGVDFAKKQLVIDGHQVKLNLWDPSGDERFHDILPNYYLGIDAVFLVFDVSDRRTLKSLTSRWLPHLRRFGRPPPKLLVLVGNKIDKRDRDVTVAMALDVANENRCMLFEVSAIEGSNVGQLVMAVAQELVNRTKVEVRW